MADFDYNTRSAITKRRQEELERRMRALSGEDRKLAQEIQSRSGGEQIGRIAAQFRARKELTPSRWFLRKGFLPGSRVHKELLNAFVPKAYQASYLYIIDKLNQFPFSCGWQRRTVRTSSYAPQTVRVFQLLNAYERLFYIGDDLTDFLYRRLDEEKSDYIRHEWNFTQNFSLIYAAEIDRGNQKVIDALKDLILSENNTAYLDREMILGILRSDNRELQRLLCGLLLAARLQEGLRQAVCETMDEGTGEAFLMLLEVICENNLIRYSSVKRAVSTWIGIFDENSVDRVNEKLLTLMGQCLKDPAFCREQLGTNDSIAISAALWALGFWEAEDAVAAMLELLEHGTKNQKLTASFYNASLFDEELKIRAARQAVLAHTDDLELVAAFLPAYHTRLGRQIWSLLYKDRQQGREAVKPHKPVLTDYFTDRREAELMYEKFMQIYEALPKGGVRFCPCIFPWYQVELRPSEVVRQLAFLAYVLSDEEKITRMASLLGEVSSEGYSSDRSLLLNLLLYTPANGKQRELLIHYMGNGEVATSQRAISIVKNLTLRKEDFGQMEEMLRFKRSNLRNQLLEFLMEQTDGEMEECLRRLLADKREEKRSAGLDLLLRLSKKPEKAAFYGKVKVLAEEMETPTDKEKVLLEEILGEPEQAGTIKKGYGLYHPDAPIEIPEPEGGSDALRACSALSEQEVMEKLRRLDAIFKAHEKEEFETSSGEKQLLSNGYVPMKQEQNKNYFDRFRLKNYPLEQELREFYETEIGSYPVFLELEAWLLSKNAEIYQNKNTRLFYQTLFEKVPFLPQALTLAYPKHVMDVRLNYRYEYLDKRFLFRAGLQAAAALGKVVNRRNQWIEYHYTGWNGQKHSQSIRVGELTFISRFLEGLGYWETDEEFAKAFYAAWNLELKCAGDREVSRFQPQTASYNSRNASAMTPVTPYWFLKAYHLGLVKKDILFLAVFTYFNRKNGLEAITRLVKGEYARSGNRQLWRWFFGEGMGESVLERGQELVGPDTWCGRLVQELYDDIVPMIVDTELRRGEADTEFSQDIQGIAYIQGTGYLVRILMALGKDTLGREAYYSWYYSNRHTRRDSLSHLLKASYPRKEDSGETLKQALSGTSIREQRLVEVAMYAPQWIDVIQEYLGWKGLKSGCYYFMAHMDEYFNDQKMAVIARYTPLSAEELRDGAFDIDWFEEAYGLLGEKNFSLLYKAAKYISDGARHARARKYADAASGKVTLADLRQQISEKRNKDLLMSYGLAPFDADRERDLLARYQFIQQYAREAKQFGAQRRASEGKAAQTALVNLSVHAGFSDVTRLILNMESRLAEEFAPFLEWKAVEDVEVCLAVDENGRSSILCRKGEKALKSVPSRLGKNAYIQELKEANKKLREQHSRTRKMMEEAMESGEEFTAAEIGGLLENAVVGAILRPLVFLFKERAGFVQLPEAGETKGDGPVLLLTSMDGSREALLGEEKLTIAHPLDLYRSGSWHEYQKHMFDRQLRQPFKQVFRELYVKLPEELGLKASRMFAGNQIQPRKTVGCLKGRRWIADYEEGLQKIYYKENIVARIYALADWFSPSDVEAPTLEWVEFSHRKTFQPLTIGEGPDLIYSEVMRDVDLAVSVAHAGGVDPETSHSTIEMRRAIVEFNLPLFGLTNVELKDSHALITGRRGKYNVHLGSGVVHQEGAAMLNILPVHSQKRGRLFLPFVDEDPKTAEIMSKIVLLAEDGKIKDPFLLDQILRN